MPVMIVGTTAIAAHPDSFLDDHVLAHGDGGQVGIQERVQDLAELDGFLVQPVDVVADVAEERPQLLRYGG